MLAGEDLRRGEHVRVDEGLVDAQERLVATRADPGRLPSVLGADVGHGRRLGVPVGHVEDRTAQLSFLMRGEGRGERHSEQFVDQCGQETKGLVQKESFFARSLTEKLPNVNTCPSMSSTAVWLLPAVTCTLGPGRACTKVGEPLETGKFHFHLSYFKINISKNLHQPVT